VIRVNGLAPPHLRNDLGPRDGNLAALVIDEVGGCTFHPHFHATKSSHVEISVKVFAAKFAVGNRLKPHRFLLRYNPADRSVFYLTQRDGRYLAARVILARLLKLRGPQKAAYMVGPKRRIMRGWDCHRNTPKLIGPCSLHSRLPTF